MYPDNGLCIDDGGLWFLFIYKDRDQRAHTEIRIIPSSMFHVIKAKH